LAHAPAGKTYLLYLKDATLQAREFDEASATVRGQAALVVDNIARVGNPAYVPTVGVSDAGTLAYQMSAPGALSGRLIWFDRRGKQIGEVPAPASGPRPAISPDGHLVAIQRTDRVSGAKQIWVTDLARGVPTRLTFSANATDPVWSPDGKRIAYRNETENTIVEKDANAGGKEKLLFRGSESFARSYSLDRKYLLLTQGRSMFLQPLTGEEQPIRVGLQNAWTGPGRISPDGKFIAYGSDESGHVQVYVQEMPPKMGKWQISVNGGSLPAWRRDGKELYFVWDGIIAVDINPGPPFSVGAPRELFPFPINPTGSYDVSADGQRFLVYSSPLDNPSDSVQDAPITVVLNWWATLKK
jgi:dipeptidyl aminopeptidase/acylaminoacyl peptidase